MVEWELLLGVGLPLGGIAIGIGRYFLKKERCFTELQNTVERLAKSDKSSTEEHDGFHDRLTIFEGKQKKNEIYLKLILDKLDIPYNP